MHHIQRKLLELARNNKLNSLTLVGMAKAIGVEATPQQIKYHLQQLQKKGLLFHSRSTGEYSLASSGELSDSDLIAIPIVGAANCGPAKIFADENIEGYLKVSKRFVPKHKDVFALKAVGNSMNKAQVGKEKQSIEDGDYILVKPDSSRPPQNEYVLSLIDGLANIKKYREGEGVVMLFSESANPQPPILIHPKDNLDYAIRGRVTQVIKVPNLQPV